MESSTCSNCGAPRVDRYCARCGQNDRNYQRSLPPMVAELLRETFEVDSRIFASLRALLFKPGELALEFSRNRRASYVSPIRLYLFFSLVFFFVLSLNTEIDPQLELVNVEQSEEAAELAAAEPGAESLIAVISDEQRDKVQAILDKPGDGWQKSAVRGLSESIAEEPTPPSDAEVFLIERALDAIDDPRGTVLAFMDNLPIVMFVLLPVFALLLKIIYVRKHRYYVEHLVFATHLHSFTFLIYTLALLLPDASEGTVGQAVVGTASWLLPILLFVYHFAALKRYYADGYAMTFFKYLVQMILYFLLLFPTAVLAVIVFTLVTV